MSQAKGLPQGILGGTFDPIHFGHLRLAEEARQALQLASIRVVPTGQPAHRQSPWCTAEQRLAMTQLAIANSPGMHLDSAEVLSAAPSYTITTLERLRRELGDEQPLVLLMGADAFCGLSRWHRWQELLSLSHIGVATRPGFPLQADKLDADLARAYRDARSASAQVLAEQAAGRIVHFEMTPLEISATAIRTLLAGGQSARFLLPDTVLDYIKTHQLYKAA